MKGFVGESQSMALPLPVGKALTYSAMANGRNPQDFQGLPGWHGAIVCVLAVLQRDFYLCKDWSSSTYPDIQKYQDEDLVLISDPDHFIIELKLLILDLDLIKLITDISF